MSDEGWFEVQQLNKFYYWKKESGQVSWTIPGTPWRKFADAQNGKVYFCHVETQKTIWKLPEDVRVPSPAPIMSASAESAPPPAPNDHKAEKEEGAQSPAAAPAEEPGSPVAESAPAPAAPAAPAPAAPAPAPAAPAVVSVAPPADSGGGDFKDPDMDLSSRASAMPTPEKEKSHASHERALSVLMNPKRNEFPDSGQQEATMAKLAGNNAFNKKDFVGARQFYDQAVALDPECANFYFNRSATFFCLKDLKSALVDARKCVALAPDNTAALARLGFTLLKCKEYSEAEEVYARALQLEPGSVRSQRGLIRVREGRSVSPSRPSSASPAQSPS